ncbi:MAG TPA: hypothetical protein O0X48_06145 [Methanocorpusculum sp.]|nr:hypothetical protein [Methanocorpusculum sp.]HJJ94359.1 hypothetical protein [Methanocorpusculum sp.]
MVSDIVWGIAFIAVAAAILFFFIKMVKKSMNGDCGCGCGGACSACKSKPKKK